MTLEQRFSGFKEIFGQWQKTTLSYQPDGCLIYKGIKMAKEKVQHHALAMLTLHCPYSLEAMGPFYQ